MRTGVFVLKTLLFIICGIATSIHIISLKNGIDYNFIDWLLFGFCFLGYISIGLNLLYSGSENKSIMELNLLATGTEYIDMPKDTIFHKGDYVIYGDKEYLIDKVRYHITMGKVFQITYVAYEDKRDPLTKEQIKLMQSMGLPLYA